MSSPADMPRVQPPGLRETFVAFAKGANRAELMASMRAQAEAYFGRPVVLMSAYAQPGPNGGTTFAYQGTSKWAPS